MTAADFTEAYQGAPPWEIDRPQAAVVALADEDGFTGRVLDVGCGTGENSLHLASRGLAVLGIDGVPAAVRRARAKAAERGLDAEFALVLPTGGRVHLLQISELGTGDYPKITLAELTEPFAEGWETERVQETTYATTGGDVPARLVSLRRR